MENIGIKETKEVLLFGLKLGNATDRSLSDDGQISWTEWLNFLPAAKAAIPAISDIGKVPAELKDLDEAEADELTQLIIDELDLADDVTEEKIEAIFAKAMEITIAIMGAVAIIRESKNEGE